MSSPRCPAFYGTEATPAEEKVIHLHYFVGGCDWYVAELSEDRRTAFGFACLGDPRGAEWGYVDLEELRSGVAWPRGYPVVVECDLHWTARPFSAIEVAR